jgi:hypothetical protein
MAIKLDSPRLRLSVDNWPMADRRGTAIFGVNRGPDGLEMAWRRTVYAEGCPSAKKYSPFGVLVRICSGSDGKTYIVGIRTSGVVFMLAGTMRTIKWFNNDCPQAIEIKRVLEC